MLRVIPLVFFVLLVLFSLIPFFMFKQEQVRGLCTDFSSEWALLSVDVKEMAQVISFPCVSVCVCLCERT